jgi:arylsulfatase A-like enzyme
VAYMDACLQTIFNALETLDLVENTIVVLNSDHGETLYDHDCYFDHHGMYDQTLHVPLVLRYPGKIPAGKRVAGYNTQQDLLPTLLELSGIESEIAFDGHSLLPMVKGEVASHTGEFYITECTWMRKHGWRTPEWKLIEALEPDMHFKPPVELYNLVQDPGELVNLVETEPQIVKALHDRMHAWIAKREKETGLPDPIYHQGDWHGHKGVGAFKTSQQAYDTLHIGDPAQAAKLQSESRK